MHDFIHEYAYLVDFCPPSARVYCESCGIEAIGYASTDPEDYAALEKELVERYTSDCDMASDVLLIEHVMLS